MARDAESPPWLDRLLLRWAPRRAFHRAQARAATHAVQRLTRSYDSASRSRRTEGWLTAGGASANAELRWQLGVLRDRSRDHCRNNPYGRRIVRRLTSSVVGYGITGTIEGPNARKAARLAQLWKEWTGGTTCDQRGRQTFCGLQRLACRTWFESGECLIRRTWAGTGTPSPLALRLQVLEPDYLDDFKQTIGVPPLPPSGENRLNQGVELDADDKAVAYWLYPYHPGDAATVVGAAAPAAMQIPPYGSSQRVDAKDILHLFYEERAGQCRGVPLLSTVGLKLRDLDEYEDAHLIRQKIAACFAVFLTQPEGMPPLQTTSSEQPLCERVEPGMVENLPAGWDVHFANPPGVAGYDEFMGRQLQGVGSGTDVPYEELSGDYSRVNFSSARMARGAYHDLIEELQWTVFIPQFCDRVFGWFKEAAQLAGIPGATDATICWTVPRKMLVDPAREIPATIKEVRAGLTSPQEAIRELGNDPDHILDEWEEFAAELDKRALVLDLDPRRVAPAGNPVVPPAAGPDLTEEPDETPSPPVASGNGKGAPPLPT
jgi:lambda family phage portal protein